MERSAGRSTVSDELLKRRQVVGGLVKGEGTWTCEPMIDLVKRAIYGSRLGEDSPIGDHSKEFVKDRPAEPHGLGTGKGFDHSGASACMCWHVGPVGIDEQIGVEGDHRCIATSRSSAHDIAAAVGVRPPVPKVKSASGRQA